MTKGSPSTYEKICSAGGSATALGVMRFNAAGTSRLRQTWILVLGRGDRKLHVTVYPRRVGQLEPF
jgi:hypothetical protein